MIVTSTIAFGVAFALTPLCRRIALRHGLLDVPNARSSHSQPTPRSGGAAILAAFLIAVLALLLRTSDRRMAVTVIATCVMAALGFADDVRRLSEAPKFAVQLGTAIALVVFGDFALPSVRVLDHVIPLAAAGPFIAVLWLVSLTNAFNFMDGINGIASLQAIASGAALAVLFSLRGDTVGACAAAALAAAAAGFVPWNLPSGSIFMGDGGSMTFGFGFAALVLRLATVGGSFVAGMLAFAPFLADTGITLTRRILRGERFFSAHRSHYYQRLVKLGWSHAAASLVWFFLALLSAATSIALDTERALYAFLFGSIAVVSHFVCFGAIAAAEQRPVQAD